MKPKNITRYATIALYSASFIALNNCGSHTNSSIGKDKPSVGNVPELSSAATDSYALPAPYATPSGYVPLMYIETQCNDGIDNDGDGLPDCMDNDCHIHPECSEFGPPLEELVNSRALTVYPNGILVNEDIAIRNKRSADDDDTDDFISAPFFPGIDTKDCWVAPVYQDPYYNIPLGEAFIAGQDGPVGPQFDPSSAIAYFGPRAGLINECEYGTDLMFWHTDDDNDLEAADDDDDEGEDGVGSDHEEGEANQDHRQK